MNFAFKWDWKEQPNWLAIQEAVGKMIAAKCSMVLFLEIETESDENGLLITSCYYTKADVKGIWEQLVYK